MNQNNPFLSWLSQIFWYNDGKLTNMTSTEGPNQMISHPKSPQYCYVYASIYLYVCIYVDMCMNISKYTYVCIYMCVLFLQQNRTETRS